MSALIRLSQPWTQSMRQVFKAARRVSIRLYSERNDTETGMPPKTSAAAQLAQALECETKLESPEPVQRLVVLENVRSKINELDQRKLRHQEYAEMLKQLIVRPTVCTEHLKLPFKQSLPDNNMRQLLRNCSSMEEVLQLTSDPKQLANELVHLCWELATEKRKNDVVLESYLELKQLQANLKIN